MNPAEIQAKIQAATDADRAANPAKWAFLDVYQPHLKAVNAVRPAPRMTTGDRGGPELINASEITAFNATPDVQLLGQQQAYGYQQGYLAKPKKHFLDRVSDVVGGVVQAVTVAGIGAGVAGIAGFGPAASGGFTPAEVAAGSDAGFLPPPVAATPLASTAASSATLGTGIVSTAKTLGVLAGTAASVASAANSFKNTKAASDVTPATFPTMRSVWRPADAAVPDPAGDSGAKWLLLAAALFGGAVLIA